MSEIEGPLGIWPFPVLNTLIQLANQSEDDDSSAGFKEYNVKRDEQGRIQGVEIIRGGDVE